MTELPGNTRVLAYLPPFYEEVKEFQALAHTEDAELAALRQGMQMLFDDQFVLTSSTAAVRRRERMLGIQVDPALETLPFRRLRIVNRYSTKPPFTLRYLQERMDALAGKGRAVVSLDAAGFLLEVTTALDDTPLFREFEYTVKTIKPANLVYQQRTSIVEVIGLKKRISTQQVLWQTGLGSWQLGSPFATYGSEVSVV